MIDECFTRAGWSSNLLVEPSRPQLLSAVAGADYELIGLTVSCDCHIGQLTSLIVAIRNVSRNPNVRVMLGGRLLIEDPDLVHRAGADATAASALDALEVAERLLSVPQNAAYA
jgi:methanogenic corrinoid protein MtbC1